MGGGAEGLLLLQPWPRRVRRLGGRCAGFGATYPAAGHTVMSLSLFEYRLRLPLFEVWYEVGPGPSSPSHTRDITTQPVAGTVTRLLSSPQPVGSVLRLPFPPPRLPLPPPRPNENAVASGPRYDVVTCLAHSGVLRHVMLSPPHQELRGVFATDAKVGGVHKGDALVGAGVAFGEQPGIAKPGPAVVEASAL